MLLIACNCYAKDWRRGVFRIVTTGGGGESKANYTLQALLMGSGGGPVANQNHTGIIRLCYLAPDKPVRIPILTEKSYSYFSFRKKSTRKMSSRAGLDGRLVLKLDPSRIIGMGLRHKTRH